MNCFELRNRTSDFLDGILIGEEKRDAELHLKDCAECTEAFKHYRMLLSAIEVSPRAVLPAYLGGSVTAASSDTGHAEAPPFHRRLPKISDWRRLPWYVRTTLEGTGIVFLILVAISAGPQLRGFYERHIERSVSEFNDTLHDDGSGTPNPADLPALAKVQAGAQAGAMEEEIDGESEEGETEVEEAPEEPERIRVGNSEIWRFNLKTDSPKEIRNRIVQILLEQRVPRDTAGLGGIEAPGGIQFDLLIPSSAIAGLKRGLQRAAPKAPDSPAQASPVEAFAWYRNRSKKAIPSGKTRVVIWLSQI